MTEDVAVFLLDAGSDSWSDEIGRLRSLLGAPKNPYLFPRHFLEATFPRIGGRIAVLKAGGRVAAAGFLFPRNLLAGAREFTLRLHKAHQDVQIDPTQVTSGVEALLEPARVVFYDPQAEQQFAKTAQPVGGVEIGRPDRQEAIAVRSLQQQIWGSEPDALYPVDTYSSGFRAGTALVARLGGKPVGFLLGFYKFDGSPLPSTWAERYQHDFRLESQVLGVLREARGRGIGTALKTIQARNARREGIDVVNWTVDPLQYGNAILNFVRLRAVAFDFYPNYYAFRNELNQVPASRFGVTWLVSSRRVEQALAGHVGATVVDLAGDSSIPRINGGWAESYFEEDAPSIAIEIPADWTGLQKRDLQEALRWREATDRLFQHYLGCEEGKYVVTGAGQDGPRKYLIAERVDSALLERLAA